MIISECKLRPRYGEVDQMGYVYHANYVSYCHQARTELMRQLGINDSILEAQNIMMPVISFDIKYKKAAHYDEEILIKTTVCDIPKVILSFDFAILNSRGEILSTAKSTVAFVYKDTRKPMRAPNIVSQILEKHMSAENKSKTNEPVN